MFIPKGKVAVTITGCVMAAATVLATLAAYAQGPMDYAGIWYDDTGQGAVEIQPCGTSLCGRIVWLKNALDDTGRPLTDGYNPDPASRRRPICGLPVLGGVKPQVGGTWDAGWIYDPKEGKSYDVELKLRGPNQLEVTGYIGVKLLSETLLWTRAPADLKKCG